MKIEAGKRAIIQTLQKTIKKEVRALQRKDELLLKQKASVNSMKTFTWDTVLSQTKEEAPILVGCLTAAAVRQGNEVTPGEMQGRKPLNAGIGCSLSILLHLRSPQRFKLFQEMNSVQLWRGGCKHSVSNHNCKNIYYS